MGSHEGSPNDHVGISSEVASVIREFTEPVSEDGDTGSDGKLNDESVRFNIPLYVCVSHFLDIPL